MPRERALELIAEWDASRDSRLTWLSQFIGPLALDDDDILRALSWYGTWRRKPIPCPGNWVKRAMWKQPSPPVWWVPERERSEWTRHVTEQQSVGVDAIVHLAEAVLMREFPGLARHVPDVGNPRAPDALRNFPTLAFQHGSDTLLQMPTLKVMMIDHDEHPSVEMRTYHLWKGYAREAFDRIAAGPPTPPPTPLDRLEAGALFEVVRDPGETEWQVYFDDDVAWDFEDDVAAFAAALAADPKVKHAYHSDREVVAVEGVTKKWLIEWATNWWRGHLS